MENVYLLGAAVKMEHFQAALDPRKQELLEARFLGARVSWWNHLNFICLLRKFCLVVGAETHYSVVKNYVQIHWNPNNFHIKYCVVLCSKYKHNVIMISPTAYTIKLEIMTESS